MPFELRPISGAELVAFTEAEYAAFGDRPTAAQLEGARTITELDRTIAVFDAGSIVGTAGAFTFDLTVPGPVQLPAAGVTAVTVLPTHRRRGLLTRMMRRQLDDVAERGEPIALLTASEGSIYGRFGYGPAIHFTVVELERSRSRLAPVEVPGRLVLLDREAAGKVLPPIWDAMRRVTVGQVGRGAAFWGEMLRDGGVLDEGGGTRFSVIHERAPGDADGYATYRIESRPDPTTGGSRRYLSVREVISADHRVRAAIWQYLLGVDLIDVVRAYQPPDDPLRWQLTDSRQARVAKLADHIWARLVDVPAALSGRRYAGDGRLVIEVRDAFRPSSGGTFELEAGRDGATCRRVDAEPDLRMDASDLGSAYLGGVRFGVLARAGRVIEETAGTAAAADRLFAVDPLPWCDSDF